MTIQTFLPSHYECSKKDPYCLEVVHEEEALVWLWAHPSLIPWPRLITWVFSPVTGKAKWPGDLWGVDSEGELIILENKKDSGGDPFEDFVGYHRSDRAEFLADNLFKKWRGHYSAELAFPDTFVERGRETGGILPRSSKRAAIRRWPYLAASIDAQIRKKSYAKRVEIFLAKRRQRSDPRPHYCGLLVVSDDGQAKLSQRGRNAMQAIKRKVGAKQVHLFTCWARLIGKGTNKRVEITFRRVKDPL